MENQNNIKYGRGKNPNSRNGFKVGNNIWLGRNLTDEHKEKLRVSKIGKRNPMFGMFRRDKNTKNWDGNKVEYIKLHRWVYKNLGNPKTCVNCQNTTLKVYHWANISKLYKKDISDWVRLCPKCHNLWDRNKLIIKI